MKSAVKAGAWTLVVLAAVALWGWFADARLGWNPGSTLLNTGHTLLGSAFPWRMFWISVILAVPAAVLAVRELGAREAHAEWERRSSSYRSGYSRTHEPAAEEPRDGSGVRLGVAGAFVVVVLLAGFVMSLRSVNRHGHDVAHEQINEVLTVENDASTASYEVRDPYDLAYARLQRSVGDTSGFAVPEANVWRFQVDGEFLTCGLKLPQAHAWRRPMGGVVCVDDSNKVVEAAFTGEVPTWKFSPRAVKDADLRLANAVVDIVPRGEFDNNDVYGYIQDGKPYMVVPVTRRMGGLAYHTGWVGSIVYDVNGDHRLVTDPAEIPGPAVGESAADQVLNALGHRGGFIESKRAAMAYDLGDGANVKHFLLERSDEEGERLVTLLTPRGSSQTVTAVLEIDPHTVVDGWPKATLYRLTARSESGVSRASVAEVIDLVRQRYGTAMQLEESQHKVLEATPADADELIVTVGSNQRVFARVSVNMMDRSTCVYTPAGDEARCDGPDAAPLALGSLRELFSSNDAPASNGSGQGEGNLDVVDVADLSDEELSDLLRQVADELDTRRAVSVPQQ